MPRNKTNQQCSPSSARLLLAGCLSLFALCVGCQTARVEKPITATAGGNDPDQQIDFWHRLAEQPITSYDDAFHALLLFADGQDPANDYAGRVAALKTRGWLANGFDRPAEEAVDRGTVSVALAKALEVRGGLVMSLFGPSRRYATKELEFLEVFPASSPNQTFSGSEFLAVMSKAEEYQKAEQSGGKTGGVEFTPPEMELKRGDRPTPTPATEPATRPDEDLGTK
jgi:hypothetical protein